MKLIIDDLRGVLKLLSVPLNDDRLNFVANLITQDLEILKSLAHTDIPKDLEPSSYLRLLCESLEE